MFSGPADEGFLREKLLAKENKN